MLYRPPVHRRVLAVGTVLVLLLVLSALVFVVGSGSVAPRARVAVSYTPPVLRQHTDLNVGWRFHLGDAAGAEAPAFDDSAWANVDTPHTWNAVDGADGGNDYYRGASWYRRHLTVPTAYNGRTFVLDFAAANQVADVWCNGIHLGRHQGGYSRFRFDATSALRIGVDNVIAVRVDNAYNAGIAPLTADYTFDGGLYRDVGLWAVDPLAVTLLDNAGPGVYLRQREVSSTSATVGVTTKVVNNSQAGRLLVVRAVITDGAGILVAEESTPAQQVAAASGVTTVQTLTVADPHRWSGLTDPYLYRATIEIHDVAAHRITDVVTQPLGLRRIDLNPSTGFVLNDHHLPLHGVNLHQDRAGVGWAVTSADRVQDSRLIKEIGANAIRMAHYQHDQQDYDLADAQGFVVWAEIPLIEDVPGSAAYTASTEQQLRELITQNYNHPSVAFWSIGNEQIHDDAPTNALLGALARIAHAMDPERLSAYANCCVGDVSAVASHVDASGYNKYYGWYTGTTGQFGPWADSMHFVNPTRAIGVSEYGAGANVTQHTLTPGRPDTLGSFHPEEYQASFHEAMWKQIEARPYLWGTFVWSMFDFASDYRDEGAQPGINDKGLVSRDRSTRKDAFYWYKANWASTPTLYITSRRWTHRTDPHTQLKVYSNATTVTATLNGSPLGTRTSTDHIFTWTTLTLPPGADTVAVTATINGTPQTDSVTWTLT